MPQSLRDRVFDGLGDRRPWGRITAIDLNSGNHLWMVPNSQTPQWATHNPALAGITLPRTGSFDQVGLLVTRSLLFAGEGSGLYRAGGSTSSWPRARRTIPVSSLR